MVEVDLLVAVGVCGFKQQFALIKKKSVGFQLILSFSSESFQAPSQQNREVPVILFIIFSQQHFTGHDQNCKNIFGKICDGSCEIDVKIFYNSVSRAQSRS